LAQLKIGTCSWKYDSWRGLVYSDAPKINYLKEYSDKYESVEIDQWFWSLFGEKKVSLPDPNVIEAYKLSVPDDFRFTVKLPNSISLTHFYKKSKTEPLKVNPYFLSLELYEQVMQLLGSFGDMLGPCMLQFEYLNKQKMSSQNDFIKIFGDFLSQISNLRNFAVEIRNPNYLNEKYFTFLAEQEIQHVFLQGYYMPPFFETYEKFRDLITGSSVIRLHGPDRKGIEKKTGSDWSKIVEPKDSELDKIVDVIRDMLSRDVDVYLNVNNHYEGSAPLTIEKIKKLLGID
jgi:uncharacterized protein YecE (DUF72 family)